LIPKFDDEGELRRFLRGIVPDLVSDRGPFTRVFGQRPNTFEKKDDYETEQAMIQDVYFYHAMGAGPNEPLGTVSLTRDRLRLSYDGANPLNLTNPILDKVTAVCRTLATRMEADVKLSTFWTYERRVTCVHPLGGVPIGRNGAEGAANEHGQVFDTAGNPLTGALHCRWVRNSGFLGRQSHVDDRGASDQVRRACVDKNT
jgi:hypothetical protein